MSTSARKAVRLLVAVVAVVLPLALVVALLNAVCQPPLRLLPW